MSVGARRHLREAVLNQTLFREPFGDLWLAIAASTPPRDVIEGKHAIRQLVWALDVFPIERIRLAVQPVVHVQRHRRRRQRKAESDTMREAEKEAA